MQRSSTSVETPTKADVRSSRSSLIVSKADTLLLPGWTLRKGMRRCYRLKRSLTRSKKTRQAQSTRPPSLVCPSPKRLPQHMRRQNQIWWMSWIYSYPVSVQYLEDQYKEYEYCTVEVDGSLQQAVRLGNKETPFLNLQVVGTSTDTTSSSPNS